MSKLLLLVVMATIYVHMTHGSGMKHPIFKRNTELSSSDIACIRREFERTNPSFSCTSVERDIEALYDVDDFIEALSSNIDNFNTFCQASCGQAIVNALGTCGVYNRGIREAELVINLCSTNVNGEQCYREFDDVVRFFSDAVACADEAESTGSCSGSCRTTLVSGVQDYGCCVNLPIVFTGTTFEANELFNRCSVSRPASCPAGPVGPPGSTGGPGPVVPPVGGGAGQLMVAGTPLVITSIISMTLVIL